MGVGGDLGFEGVQGGKGWAVRQVEESQSPW